MSLYGYDISSAQGGLNIAAVPGDIVSIKATGGVDYVNPFCDGWVQQALALGKGVMVYHYVHETASRGTAEQEAQWFLDNTVGYRGLVNFTVDWESDNVTDSAYAERFKEVFEAGSGIRLWGYGSLSQLGYLQPLADGDSPIWGAGYSLGSQPINGYSLPPGPFGIPNGFNLSMWQFTSSGHLPGWNGNLDLNVFYGDMTAWQKLLAPIGGTGAVLTDSAPVPVQAPTPAPAPAPAPPAPVILPTPGAGQCRVDSGDTFSSIAAWAGVSLLALERANPGINYDLIYPGQILNLPGPIPAPVVDNGIPDYCTVDPGDTLSSIAAQYGLSLGYVERCNPGINYDLIHPTQRINLR